MLHRAYDALHHAGLVDLDASLLVQLGLFLVFAVSLNLLVVRPMMRTHEARFARMAGARKEAEAMDLRAAEAHGEYERRIGEARAEAVRVRDELKSAAEAAASEALQAVRDESARTLEAGRRDLHATGERARKDVEPVVRDLAEVLSRHLLTGTKGTA